jgi:hypothetical protein
MNKIAIFNVGGAFSCYGEFDNKKIIIDLGSGNGFSPVDDFLLKLADKGKFYKQPLSTKYKIDQVFLSHLDRDHISDYEKFDKYFIGELLTCPNDNPNQMDEYKVNRLLLGEEYSVKTLILDQMKGRQTSDSRFPNLSQNQPLISGINHLSLFYIPPKICQIYSELLVGYQNNISLVVFIQKGDKTLLIPGDLLKPGFQYLIENNTLFRNILIEHGVDYFVAPHHGLQTSFSQMFFNTIKGGRTRLNIISEKLRRSESNENRSNVDSRYYQNLYSSGENSLNQNAIKTSNGHIVIDFDTPETKITVINDNEELISQFI